MSVREPVLEKRIRRGDVGFQGLNTGWPAAQLSELQPYGSSSSLTGRAGPGDVRSRVRQDALHDPPGRAHGRGVAAELRRGELGD